jgi:hypothetical protein
MRKQDVLKLQEYATDEQIEFFDRLRSGDDTEHQCAARQLQGVVRTRGARWSDVRGSARGARSQRGWHHRAQRADVRQQYDGRKGGGHQ